MTTIDPFEKVIRSFQRKWILVINISGDYGGRLLQIGLRKKLNELGVNFVEIEPSIYLSKLSYYILHLLIKLERYSRKLNINIPLLIRIINTLQSIIVRKALIISVNKLSQNIRISAILVHGSGTMSDITPTKLAMFKAILQTFKKVPVITGPQSYWFPFTDFNSVLEYASQPVYLFCREKPSYKLLHGLVHNLWKRKKRIYIMLSHDTAFYLTKNDFGEAKNLYILVSLREDKESVISNKLKKNLINLISRCYNKVIVKDAGKASSFEEYIALIKNAKIVITDRLHVAILASLLGKKVFLLSNIYHKNIGVYQYSLAKYYDVKFYDANTKCLSNLIQDVIKELKYSY